MFRRSVIALAAAFSLVAFAVPVVAQDDITGSWEGLIAGQLTMIFNIAEADGVLSATLDVPAQNAADLPLDSITWDGASLRMTLDMVGGVYEGTLQDDGTIAGQWNQTGATEPQDLNLARKSDES